MTENLMIKDHKATSQAYRDNYDQIFSNGYKPQPPENWEDIEEFNDHCTCNKYEWIEKPDLYSKAWQECIEDYSKCCPYCSKGQCSYII